MAARFTFGAFELDPDRRRLTRGGEPVAIPERHLDVLTALVASAGRVVAKDDLIQAGWKDVAVGENSLEQVISSLRRQLSAAAVDRRPVIETVPRRGYRFAAPVERWAPREEDHVLDALLAPHRSFLEGRAALETLSADGVARARQVFEETLRMTPDHPSAHVGLANACVMQYEMARADPSPPVELLGLAVHHARESCRLDSQSGEAWATLGFVLERTGDHRDAAAAVRHAVALDPGNWRHHFRLAFVCWGEERLSAAHRTLALLPGFPLAHWLAATVYVARQALDEAERELRAGLVSDEALAGTGRFSSVALSWLLGLIRLERDDEAGALEAFHRELAAERGGHLYARECAGNTWYALGVLHLRQGRAIEAAAAFNEALARVAVHPLAQIGLSAVASFVSPRSLAGPAAPTAALPRGFDGAVVRAAALVLSGSHEVAATTIEQALARAAPGSAGWILPIEPLLRVSSRPDAWSHVLARLRNRAA